MYLINTSINQFRSKILIERLFCTDRLKFLKDRYEILTVKNTKTGLIQLFGRCADHLLGIPSLIFTFQEFGNSRTKVKSIAFSCCAVES